MDSNWLAGILTVLLIGGSLWLAISSNLLRDTSTARKPPFSFARAQLLWWVLIVAFCLLQRYATTYALPEINATCLTLMGIGVGTRAAATIIDARQRAAAAREGARVSQDEGSQGFFTDILSDDNGLSVHRLQALVFNVIYGVAFYTAFVRDHRFQDYGTMQYAVLGLSTVGYLGLKALENDPKARAAAGGDELLDPDAPLDGAAAVG